MVTISDRRRTSNLENIRTSSNGNIFRVTSHLCGKFTGHRWISLTKASDAELWCFLSKNVGQEQICYRWLHQFSSQWRHNERDGVIFILSIFTQLFIQAQIKENIKAPRHWPLCGEFTGDRWIPHNKWPVTRKMFPFDDVIFFVNKPWQSQDKWQWWWSFDFNSI